MLCVTKEQKSERKENDSIQLCLCQTRTQGADAEHLLRENIINEELVEVRHYTHHTRAIPFEFPLIVTY